MINEAKGSFSHDIPVNTEKVQGFPFRIPYIDRDEYNESLYFRNLHLPVGWQQHIDQLKSNNAPEVCSKKLQLIYEGISGVFAEHYISSNVQVDEATGVITKVAIHTKAAGIAELILVSGHFEKVGKYITRNLYQIRTANVLLSFMDDVLSSTYPVEFQRNYHEDWPSLTLALPKRFIKPGEGVLSKRDQELLRGEAQIVAGQFGQTWSEIRFSALGLPELFTISAAKLSLEEDKDVYRYFVHNIGGPSQQEALHAIGARFINKILDRNNYA